MTELKALTVCQGWASAMFLPTPKDVENRTWATNYRGGLLIHAGLSKKHLKDCADFCRWHHIEMPESLPMGAIIGAVVLSDCTRRSTSIWAQPEQFHWVLQAPQLFENPIPGVMRLAMGHFKWDTSAVNGRATIEAASRLEAELRKPR
jgi:hypothetical protein